MVQYTPSTLMKANNNSPLHMTIIGTDDQINIKQFIGNHMHEIEFCDVDIGTVSFLTLILMNNSHLKYF